MNKRLIISICLAVAIIVAVIAIVLYMNKPDKAQEITNYEQCAAAGGRIQESYPPRCVSDDGQSFVQVIE